MKITLLSLGALASAALTVSAQVIVFEPFDYADQAALAEKWTISTSPITLTTANGNPSPSVSNAATGTAANIWKGSTFSLTPTDDAPLRLSADFFSAGLNGTVTTVGLRTGADPLFEMGLYRSFDNIQTGPNTTAISSPAVAGMGTRTINIGTDLNGQDWVKMSDYFNGWVRFEAILMGSSVTTRIDLGIDGSWEHVFTENGTTPTKAFTDLRIHAPAATTAGTGGTIVDNVKLEVIPEPASLALLGLGAGLGLTRRRRAVSSGPQE